MKQTPSPAASYLLATISCILLVCSKLSVLAMPTPNMMMMADPNQIAATQQSFYSGLVLLTVTASTAVNQDFAPFNYDNSTQYQNAVNSICGLVGQVNEVNQLVEKTNSSAETIVIQTIVDNVLIDACQWMKFVSKAPAGHFNCSTPASTTASLNALCSLMETDRISVEFETDEIFNSTRLYGSIRKQKEWIKATFSGHPQAAAVLATVNLIPLINCNLLASGQVAC